MRYLLYVAVSCGLGIELMYPKTQGADRYAVYCNREMRTVLCSGFNGSGGEEAVYRLLYFIKVRLHTVSNLFFAQ